MDPVANGPPESGTRPALGGQSSGSGARRRGFWSILFAESGDAPHDTPAEAPDFFRDLNLDRVFEAVTARWKQYDLLPFFHATLRTPDAITYRQEVMRDLEDPGLMQAVASFSQGMFAMRSALPQAKEQYYRYHRERLFLEAVGLYCQSVRRLQEAMGGLDLASRGMRAFREYLNEYTSASYFQRLAAESAALASALSAVRYCLLIKGDNITVRPYEGEGDYSATIEQLFEKFRRGTVEEFHVKGFHLGGMNHVQAQVVERVARLHPDVFASLDAFCAEHAGYLDETISRFDREVQFYVAYLTYIERFRRAGLRFCYPQVSATSKEVSSRESFDLALADRLIEEKAPVVTNGFFLRGPERVFVVSGPNQGGKTTFARTFGQLHYLACLGCSVPGSEARLFLFDRLFTHFERQEEIETLRGKLQDDLVRIREILDRATDRSLVILNEVFTSTTLQDAVFLGKKIMAAIAALDLLGVCVTFLDELASFSEKTVSVMSLVDPANPSLRTFKVERKPADGLAYALSIAEKHRVTYEWLKKRVQA